MLSIQSHIRTHADQEKVKILSGFFKTYEGAYGEGDQFLGVSVPETRKIVKHYSSSLTLGDIEILLNSPYHEERLAGVLTLVEWSKKSILPPIQLAEFYISHVDRINNWDLVDTSAPHIIGPYIELLPYVEKRVFIDTCITSDHLWTNRIIVLASLYHISKLHDEALTFEIVPRFLTHPHDLIHKACGWMLREVGKRISEIKLIEFLDEYSTKMPRTMLRYAIERLDNKTRVHFMQQK